MKATMRVALGQFKELSHERLTFARQIGVSGVQLNTPVLPGEKRWEMADLLELRLRCEDYGLQLEAIENTPRRFYDRAMLGLPGRDEQIEQYQATIRNIGRAGIPVLGYHWMPLGTRRTSKTAHGRGGTFVTAFDMAELQEDVRTGSAADHPLTGGRAFGEGEMWENYLYFMQAVVPVAEAAGVKLALHPDDPPVPALDGIARLFGHFDGFKRAIELVPSPNVGLNFCMGCWSEMGPGVLEALRYFGERAKVFYVHFRDVQGCVPAFQECFLGEGNVDVVAAMRVLKEVDFDGFIIDDHVPRIVDDTEWGHRGHAFATGYIMALVEAVHKLHP